MTEFEAAITHRNKRLEAYRLAGVPLKGKWFASVSEREAMLVLTCKVCGRIAGTQRTKYLLWGKDLDRGFAADEREALKRICRNRKGPPRCKHLLPLLGEDNEEIRLLMALG